MSYVSTVDIAAVAAAALTDERHDGKAYTLTGAAALTIGEVAEHISAAVGRTIRYVEAGPAHSHPSPRTFRPSSAGRPSRSPSSRPTPPTSGGSKAPDRPTITHTGDSEKRRTVRRIQIR